MKYLTLSLGTLVLIGFLGCFARSTPAVVIRGAEVAPPEITRPAVVQVGSEASYRGIYTGGFETSRFVPCGSDEEWWLEWTTAADPGDGQFLVIIDAKVTDVGRYGHLGRYHRQADVKHLHIVASNTTRCE